MSDTPRSTRDETPLETPDGRRFLRKLQKITFEDSSSSEGEQQAKLERKRHGRLRSGKIFRRSNQVGECRVELRNMVDVNKISQLISNNIPLLSAENNGKSEEEIHIFIKCCEYVENCLEDREKETFLKLLPTRLRGQAAHKLDGAAVNTVEDFKKLVKTKLIQSKDYHLLRAELHNSRQLPGESLEIFCNRLQKLVKDCSEAMEEKDENKRSILKKDLEQHAIYILKSRILNPNVRLYLLQNEDLSFSSVVSKAINLERAETQSIYFLHQQGHPQLNYTNQSPYTYTPYTLTNQQLSTTVTTSPNITPSQNRENTRINNPVNKNSNNSRPQSFKCGFCGKVGHTYGECRTRKNTPYCTNCKMYGHKLEDCPKNKQQVQKIEKESRTRKKCNFCLRLGHSEEECNAKKKWMEGKSTSTNANQGNF